MAVQLQGLILAHITGGALLNQFQQRFTPLTPHLFDLFNLQQEAT